MDEQLKQRLVGAAVIVSLIVIFVPMLWDEPEDTEPVEIDTQIPDKPAALQQPLPSREILPKPVPQVPMTSLAEPQQAPEAETSVSEAETMTPEPDRSPDLSSIPEPIPIDGEREAGRSTPVAWLVQVASFTQQENATRLVDRLKQANMPAQLQEVTIGGKRHYRVQMLPQLDRKDAEKLIERIKNEFKLTATLLRYSD